MADRKFKRTPATISITRPSNADADDGKPIIRMYVRVDGGPRQCFEVAAENFALALTGWSETPMVLVEPEG